jgi:plastocyanin
MLSPAAPLGGTMSCLHAPTRPASLLAALFALTCLGLVAAGCSSKSTGAPAVVTGPTFNLSFPANGVSHEVQFNDVGSWDYHCIPHQSVGMTGTIVVDANSTVDSLPAGPVQVGGGTGFQFVPQVVTIKPGGHVRWVNFSGATNHTVTRQ